MFHVLLDSASEMDVLSLLKGASLTVQAVMALLVLMSVVSWFIIGTKALYLGRALARSIRFQEDFFQTQRLDDVWKLTEEQGASPVAEVFRAGYTELAKLRKRRATQGAEGYTGSETQMGDIESIERALSRARTTAITEMESKIPFLATTASAAPFIGLFGTVWGIMNSFRSIGAKGAANLATVAPGIAEALIATALGLVAAIPAVMAYNYFSRRIKVLAADMDNFASDFLNIIRRRFF
jgi:biopolymer transport protein TolQ